MRGGGVEGWGGSVKGIFHCFWGGGNSMQVAFSHVLGLPGLGKGL